MRVDSGVREGDAITPFYDPMIAKLVCWGETRDVALARLRAALVDYEIVGPISNVDFLWRVTGTQAFCFIPVVDDLIVPDLECMGVVCCGKLDTDGVHKAEAESSDLLEQVTLLLYSRREGQLGFRGHGNLLGVKG